MTITTRRVRGIIVLPDGTAPRNGRVTYQLSGWDREGVEAVMTGPITVQLDADAVFDDYLWCTDTGQNGRVYLGVVAWHDGTARRELPIRFGVQSGVGTQQFAPSWVVGDLPESTQADALAQCLAAAAGASADAVDAAASASAAAASAAAAALFDPDNFQPINPRLTALSGLPAPSARAVLIGTAAGGYTNRARPKRLLLFYSQSNFAGDNAASWTPPENLFVWNGGVEGAIGTAFGPCPNTLIRTPYAIAARMAEADPDTDYYVVVCATGGTELRAVVGMDYTWSSSTSGDPGTGAVALDTGGTALRYAETDAGGFLRFGGGTDLGTTTAYGGTARIEVIADPTIYVTLDVTGSGVDSGAYRSQACTIAASASWPPTNGTPVRLYPAKHWLREIIRANCEAALTALGLTGTARKFDQVFWWHTEGDLPYPVAYGARDFDAFMAYVGQWTDSATIWANILPWPYYTASMQSVYAFWEVILRKCMKNNTMHKVISLISTLTTDWTDSNNVHQNGAAARFKIGRLIADALAAGGGGPTYDSGNWTPTITLGANAAAATPGACVYQRVGDVVEVSGRINVTATALDTTTVVNITLPVPSTLRGGDDGGGLVLSTRGEVGDAVTNYVGGVDVLTLTWTCKLVTGHALTFNAMYMIR